MRFIVELPDPQYLETDDPYWHDRVDKLTVRDVKSLLIKAYPTVEVMIDDRPEPEGEGS